MNQERSLFSKLFTVQRESEATDRRVLSRFGNCCLRVETEQRRSGGSEGVGGGRSAWEWSEEASFDQSDISAGWKAREKDGGETPVMGQILPSSTRTPWSVCILLPFLFGRGPPRSLLGIGLPGSLRSPPPWQRGVAL